MTIKQTTKIRNFQDIAGRRMKEEKWTGNVLQLYAENILIHVTDIEDIMNVDMTNKFFKELDREIKNGEIIKVQINAKPRMGKSTVGIALGFWILEMIKEYHSDKCQKEDFSMKNICRDDQEKSKVMRNPDLMYTILVTDEQNALERTGENSTTESAQREVFSDVQAGRYIHNIDICPEGEIDKNSDIKLEIRNREHGMCHCYLYYKVKGDWILIGYVDLNVSKLIKNWKKVESRFFRYLKHKEEKDKKFIEYWSKKDFYVEYMTKKYEKMELMNREGILRPRELDYAGIVLNVIDKTKGLIQIMSLQKIKNPIMSYVELEFKEQKIPVSLIGVEMATRRVISYLTLLSSKRDIKNEMKNCLILLNKNKISEREYNKSIRELKEHEEELDNLVKIQYEEMKRYKQVNDKYNAHLK